MINNQKYLLILCFFSGTRSDVASSFQILATSPPTNPPCPTSTCKNKILNLQICKSPCNSKIYILIFTKPWIYVFSSGTFSTPPLMPRQNAMQRLQTLNVTTSFVREWWDLMDLIWSGEILLSFPVGQGWQGFGAHLSKLEQKTRCWWGFYWGRYMQVIITTVIIIHTKHRMQKIIFPLSAIFIKKKYNKNKNIHRYIIISWVKTEGKTPFVGKNSKKFPNGLEVI